MDNRAFNAIRISDKIEKVFIDFSSYDSLKESSGFERLYTVHTAKTMEISNLLGFHVAGFCDDYGVGGSELAASFSGYDSLPSDLILCLIDDKYNFLPLNETQLERLFVYLRTGRVIELSGGSVSKTDSSIDVIEEVKEDDDDAAFKSGVIFVSFEASWPDSEDDYKYSGTFAYPLFIENKRLKPSFPYFDDFFDVVGVDDTRDLVTIKVYNGDIETIYDINLDETIAVEFDYHSQKLKKATHRKGVAKFSYHIFDFSDDVIPGKIDFTETQLTNGVEDICEAKYLESICDDEDKAGYVDLENDDRYFIFLCDYIHNFVLLYGFRFLKSNDKEAATLFIPLFLDKPVSEIDTYKDEKGRTIEYNLTIKHVEGVLDEKDSACLLKIYDKQKGKEYVFDVVDGFNKLDDNNYYIHVGRINNKTHELAVFIGHSSRKRDCKYYYASLKTPVEYIEHINGEKREIKVEVIKK